MAGNHGQDRRYHHPRIGVNARMDTIQAAVLLGKLEIFDGEVRRRGEIGRRYSELLEDLVVVPEVSGANSSVFAQYTIEVNGRPAFQQRMAERGVPTTVHYPEAIHLQPAFAHLGYRVGDFPCAERAAERVVSLPMHPYLAERDLAFVVGAVRESIAAGEARENSVSAKTAVA